MEERVVDAMARAERDEAVKRRDFAVSGEENLRYLKQLWEQECGYYRAKWWEAVQANDRSRRTIRRLVMAARAMGHVARVWRSEDVEWSWVLEDARARIAYMQDRQAEAERQAKEG